MTYFAYEKHSHLLSELFHYDPSQKKTSELRKGLTEYQFLLLTAALAIKSFLDGDFEKFDSLVGENACQIRAIKIALIASENPLQFDGLLSRINTVLAAIADLLNQSSINSLMRQGCSLSEVISRYDLEVQVSPNEMFLIQSYLLSEMKECQSDGEFLGSLLRKERCSPSVLQKKFPQISYSFVDKLAKKLREHLSRSSVDFVRKTASNLRDPSLIGKVAEEFEIKHNDLACIPTFWSFKALFSFAVKKGIPLIVHARFLNELENGYRVLDEEVICYKPCPFTELYKEIDISEIDLSLPACVVQGAVCPKNGQRFVCKKQWKENVKKHSILDVLFSIGASHRQYPDSGKQILTEEIAYEYKNYKVYAEKNGFSLNNPTTFFAQHIYCAQINKMALPHSDARSNQMISC